MAKRILSKGRFWIRRQVRRFQRWLGLPALSCRATMLVLLVLLLFAYVSVKIWGGLITKMGSYSPKFYEPKDVEREHELQKRKEIETQREKL